MSVFSDKRVFGIKRQNCGGVSTAGQVCANDVILWVIFLLPINIVIHGAGQCLVAMGLFVGNVVGCITSNDNDYFFATNISLSENDNQFLSADGLSASKISLSILRDLGIYAYGYQSE